jgi:acetate kinase
MGFSTLDGVPMSTRCGALDAGVILYLLVERGMSVSEVEALLYQRSGLLGMSRISGDARALQESAMPEAKEALEAFAFQISRSVAALATSLQGLDGIVFTGGIGEHQPRTRAGICERLGWLGVKLDHAANGANATSVSASDSAVAVLVIPANEEQQIASDVVHLLTASKRPSGDEPTHL